MSLRHKTFDPSAWKPDKISRDRLTQTKSLHGKVGKLITAKLA